MSQIPPGKQSVCLTSSLNGGHSARPCNELYAQLPLKTPQQLQLVWNAVTPPHDVWQGSLAAHRNKIPDLPLVSYSLLHQHNLWCWLKVIDQNFLHWLITIFIPLQLQFSDMKAFYDSDSGSKIRTRRGIFQWLLCGSKFPLSSFRNGSFQKMGYPIWLCQ